MPGLKIFEALNQMPEMVDPQTGLVKPKEVNLSVTEKQNFSNEDVSHIRYDKGLFYDKAKDLQDNNIALGSDPQAVNDVLAEKQSTLGAAVNALTKFVGKTAITVGDTLGGMVVAIPTIIRNGTLSSVFDNDFHRAMDKASNWMENVMPIYETKAQEEENFWSKLNNAKFWGDGVMGGLSFTVGAVLSEMALSAITASTFGNAAPLQAAETAGLMSRAKKIFSLFGKDATSAELKAFGKDITKSLAVGAGYEAGVEARQFLDTARQNYIDQYKQQYGTEPTADLLAKADGEIKKTANLIFSANMALLSVDNYIQFKNIFGKGLSTDLKLFGKSAVKTEGKELAKDFALRGTLEANYETASKLRKTLYTVPKLLKNPLNEGFEEGTQGLFQSIGQDYIKKKYDATAYENSFNLIDSFSKNFKDAYLSEDAGIGFIIGAMGIPGMGIATGKVKEAKGIGNKLIASFEGGIAEVFEENRAEKEAIKNAIKLSSKVNVDNILNQLKATSVNYHTTQQRDAALENGDFFEAKNAESDNMFSFVKTRDNLGLLNESKEQYSAMIKGMDDVEFAKTFGYDKISPTEKVLSSMELYERKKKVVEAFNKKVDNFQKTKELASKVAPVRNFNDENARLYNEAIHHLMYTTNDLDNREDSMVNSLKDKMSKTKDIDSDRVKELMNFHNTWYNLTQGKYSKELQAYLKDLALLERYSSFQHTTSEDDVEYKENQEKTNKVQKRIKQYETLFEREITKFGENQSKLANYGFNIDYNFENMDSFRQATKDYENFKKDIETHLNQNIFDKNDINQTLEDLQKIQNKRHELIGTYNHLNSKEGNEEFKTLISKTKRDFKIQFLKAQAQDFLHNRGAKMDEDTVKEIKKNVDLQIEEDDNEITKEIKSQTSELIDKVDNTSDVTELKQYIEDLKELKESEITPELSKVIDEIIKEINDKIKSLEDAVKNEKITKQQNQQLPVFHDIKNLFRLQNSNEQKKILNDAIASLDDSKSQVEKEDEFRSNLTFSFEIIDNPTSVDDIEVTINNDNVKIVSGIRAKNMTFNFKMFYKGQDIGGFTMPNQIYIKNSKGIWSQIDFEKLDNDVYLESILKKLFPGELISTKEDRLEIGKYLSELNDFSNKLADLNIRNIDNSIITKMTFSDLDDRLKGLLSNNSFTSQYSMNVTPSSEERSVEEILDNPDDVITKAAIKNVDGQDIVIFGRSSSTGQGFSKRYFVKIINGKLERNNEGKIVWNDVDGSNMELSILKLFNNKENKDRSKYINTKNSLFSLLVFEANGYIRPIFTTNETIGKLQNKEGEFVTTFIKNRKNIQPLTEKIGDEIKEFFNKFKDKKSSEIDNKKDTKYISDIFFSVKNTGNSKIEITPVISPSGELSFQIQDRDNKDSKSFVNTYIYFNGTNFIKINTKGDEKALEIFNQFKNGEITLAEKLDKLKPYSEVINNLNEVMGDLLLSGKTFTEKDFNDNKKQYTILNAVKQVSKSNNAVITGFYNNFLLSKDNQQNLEKLQIKQDINYFLYLRPGNSSVSDIEDFSEKVKRRNEAQEDNEVASTMSINNDVLDKQEEADTVEKVVSNSPDVISSGGATVFEMLNPTTKNSSTDDDLLIQAGNNIGLSLDNITMLNSALGRNSKLRNEFERLKTLRDSSTTEETSTKTEEVVQQEVVKTPNIDKLEELGISYKQIPTEEKLISTVYRRKNIESKGVTIEEFTQLVKDAVKELEDNTEGVNKILKLSNQDLIEYNQAVKNLMQILPIKTKDNPDGIIEITDVLDILKNLKTKGEVGGRFIAKMRTIYLATEKGKSVKGVEYHEAFHAIFRMFLTDSQINKYLRASEAKYGTPTAEQLLELKNSSSDLVNLSQQELKNLWLEEKMADSFMDFMKVGPVKTPESWLQRLFFKLRSFIMSLFNNKKSEDSITRLFEEIYQGKFKDAKEKFPVVRKGITEKDVNKLLVQEYKLRLSNGKFVDKKGYLSHSISEAIINTVTNEAKNKLQRENRKAINNDEILDIYEKIIERFNPENEHNISQIDSIKDDDLAYKLASNYLNVYDSLQNVKNGQIVLGEVLQRLPLYNIDKEASTLQEKSDEEINEEESIADDEGDSGIVNKKTNEINHAWEKASKRVKQYISSASIKTDLFNIGKPFIDFMEEQEKLGNTNAVKNYEFAIRGSHLYSNLIKMLVNTPSYKMIGMVYSMSDVSPEMKYFVQHWFTDIYKDLKDKLNLPVVNTTNLDDLYNVLKNISYADLNNKSEHFTFMSSDLEKNRIFLWDIVFDNSGVTKFLNANNREVAKQVFNKWAKNWESQRINSSVSFQKVIDDYSNLYFDGAENIFNEYVDFLSEKISSEEKAEKIQNHISKIQKEFSKLGIVLPSGYVKYSLISYVVNANKQELLSEKQLDWFNNFSASGIKAIDKDTLVGIESALLAAKKYETYSIYTNIKDDKDLDIGAISRLKNIGEAVGVFDPTVIPSSFNNQEGKRIYDIVPPSDISRRINVLKDTNNVAILKDYIKTKDAQAFKDLVLNNDVNNTYYFYSFFTSEAQVNNFLQTLDNNPLFKLSQDDKFLETVFSTLDISYAGGIRQDELEISSKENSDEIEVSSKGYGLFSESEGKSYSNADITSKLVYQLSLLADSQYNKYNIKEVDKQKYAFYKFTQPEGKSTVPIVLLPFNELISNSQITEKGKEMMLSLFNQEYDRITKVQKEINEFVNGKKSGYVENYHYVNQEVGIDGTNNNRTLKIFKNSEDKYYYLDHKNNNVAIELKPEELWFNEQQEDGSFVKKKINKSKLNPRGIKFFNLGNTEFKFNDFIEKARKGETLTTQEDDFIKAELQRFFNVQFEDFIKLLKQSDINIIKVNDEGQEVSNLLPAGFIQNDSNLIDRSKLMNAFLNDYLMSYSINSLLYGDNANVAKDSVDWVKRAGGIIGSGPNYGNGESNIILIKSEEKDKIDTTDAQTFSNPFWHLTTILKNKGAYNKEIIDIYRKIDSGLETPTAKEYQQLYDNQAQHQPNKTQGYGFEHYLKTSISPLLRSEVSRLKRYNAENREYALELHKKLFDFKLQNNDVLFNTKFKDNEQIQNYFTLLKEFHDMFEAIPGMEYKHNLLNTSELHNGLIVYDSAWKRNKTNVHNIDRNGKPYLYKNENNENIIEPIRISNATMVDQQKTDGVKSTTIDGTQKQRLILTEQDKKAITKFKDKEITIDTVLSTMEKLQAMRIKRGFNKLKKEIIDDDGNAVYDTLLASFQESIPSSDPQILELFQDDGTGKPKFNLNNPAIEIKFQAMFLSFISNNTLKHKTAGSKFTLMSEIGFNLMRELDDKGNIVRTLTNRETKRIKDFDSSKFISHRLRHDVEVKNSSGTVVEYYSEIVVSERFLKKFGFSKEQFYKGEIPQEFLYLQGIRIPTEDKHSMINAKIVDIVPDSYGNVIMMPYEIVNLSGADFDIDSLYAKVNQTYTNILNKKTEIYGSYLSKPTLEEANDQAYSEYLAESFEDRKVSATFNDLKENNKELKDLNQEKIIAENEVKQSEESVNIYTKKKFKDNLVDIKQKIKSLEHAMIEQAFDINKLIFNKGQWLAKNKTTIKDNYDNYNSGNIEAINPITDGELNNNMLELERKLTNNSGNNKIANTPTSLKIFKKLVDILEKEGLIKKEMGYGVHDMLSKTKADMAISTGAANIGPAALFNNLFGLLVKYKVSTENPILSSNLFNELSLDKDNQPITDEKEKQRVQDTLASMLAAMTDNAKEQLADVFNLTIDSLPVALTMLGTGNNFNNVMLLMKNPIVKRITELSSEFNKTVQSKEDYDNSKKERNIIRKKIESEFELTSEMFEGNLTYNELLNALKSQPETNSWKSVQTDIQNKYPEVTEELYNTLSEQEKEKLIECL